MSFKGTECPTDRNRRERKMEAVGQGQRGVIREK